MANRTEISHSSNNSRGRDREILFGRTTPGNGNDSTTTPEEKEKGKEKEKEKFKDRDRDKDKEKKDKDKSELKNLSSPAFGIPLSLGTAILITREKDKAAAADGSESESDQHSDSESSTSSSPGEAGLILDLEGGYSSLIKRFDIDEHASFNPLHVSILKDEHAIFFHLDSPLKLELDTDVRLDRMDDSYEGLVRHFNIDQYSTNLSNSSKRSYAASPYFGNSPAIHVSKTNTPPGNTPNISFFNVFHVHSPNISAPASPTSTAPTANSSSSSSTSSFSTSSSAAANFFTNSPRSPFLRSHAKMIRRSLQQQQQQQPGSKLRNTLTTISVYKRGAKTRGGAISKTWKKGGVVHGQLQQRQQQQPQQEQFEEHHRKVYQVIRPKIRTALTSTIVIPAPSSPLKKPTSGLRYSWTKKTVTIAGTAKPSSSLPKLGSAPPPPPPLQRMTLRNTTMRQTRQQNWKTLVIPTRKSIMKTTVPTPKTTPSESTAPNFIPKPPTSQIHTSPPPKHFSSNLSNPNIPTTPIPYRTRSKFSKPPTPNQNKTWSRSAMVTNYPPVINNPSNQYQTNIKQKSGKQMLVTSFPTKSQRQSSSTSQGFQ